MTDAASKSKLAYNIRLTVLFVVMMSIGVYYAYDNGYLDVYLPKEWLKAEKKVAGIPDRLKNRKLEENLDAPANKDTTAEPSTAEKTESAETTEVKEPEIEKSELVEKSDNSEPTLAELEAPNSIEPPVIDQPVEKKTTTETTPTEPEKSETPISEAVANSVEPAEKTEKQSEIDKESSETSPEVASPKTPSPVEQIAKSEKPTVEMPDVEKLKQKLLNPGQKAGTVADPSKPSALERLTNATTPRVEGEAEPVEQNAPIPAKVLRYASHLMKQYDLDRSMKMEAAEYKLLPQNLGVADLNGDGNITLEELSQYLANYGQGRKIRLITPYAAETPDDSLPASAGEGPLAEGEPTEEEIKTAQEMELDRRRGLKFSFNTKRVPAGLPPWFLTKDKNGDGQLTLSEFAPNANQTAVEEFRKLDRNQDGLLTPKEYVGGNRKKSNPTDTAAKP